jgi:hypothetical protein
MRRRQFVGIIGTAAVTWPLGARAQQPATPVIALLTGRSADGLGFRSSIVYFQVLFSAGGDRPS